MSDLGAADLRRRRRGLRACGPAGLPNGACVCNASSCPNGCCDTNSQCHSPPPSRPAAQRRRLQDLRDRPGLLRERRLRLQRVLLPEWLLRRQRPCQHLKPRPAASAAPAARLRDRSDLLKRVCVCNASSCAGGCCDGTTRRHRRRHARAAERRRHCASCATGTTCSTSSGTCICNATSCPNGCCNGTTCVAYAGQSNEPVRHGRRGVRRLLRQPALRHQQRPLRRRRHGRRQRLHLERRPRHHQRRAHLLLVQPGDRDGPGLPQLQDLLRLLRHAVGQHRRHLPVGNHGDRLEHRDVALLRRLPERQLRARASTAACACRSPGWESRSSPPSSTPARPARRPSTSISAPPRRSRSAWARARRPATPTAA